MSSPSISPINRAQINRAQINRAQINRAQINRAQINSANSQHSTGPRTASGKMRSSLNALRHGLTARNPLIDSDDHAAYQDHCRKFFAQYQPPNALESQLVQELADTSWRLNRIPLLEAALLADTENATPDSVIAHLAMLSLHSSRLSRQFERTLTQLRSIQHDRRTNEKQELRDAAALLELHKHQGTPWDPAADGFVFSKEQVEHWSDLLMCRNEARPIAWARFDLDPKMREMAGARAYVSSTRNA